MEFSLFHDGYVQVGGLIIPLKLALAGLAAGVLLLVGGVAVACAAFFRRP